MVVVPLPTFRLPITIDQQARIAPHLAVEIFHPQGLAPIRPAPEAVVGADEAVILQHFDLDAQLFRPAVGIRLETPFAGLHKPHAISLVPLQSPCNLALERTRVAGIIQPHIVDRPALLTKLFRKMAHGGKDQRQLLLVVAHITGFVHHFGHQQDDLVPVRCFERSKTQAKLVAQYENKVHGGVTCGRRTGSTKS